MSRAERRAGERRRPGAYRAPQSCPSCRRSLADVSVPPAYRAYRKQFTTAVALEVKERDTRWRCPHCGHEWWAPHHT